MFISFWCCFLWERRHKHNLLSDVSVYILTYNTLKVLTSDLRKRLRSQKKLKPRTLRGWVIPIKISRSAFQRQCETMPSIFWTLTGRLMESQFLPSSLSFSLEVWWGGTRLKALNGWGSVQCCLIPSFTLPSYCLAQFDLLKRKKINFNNLLESFPSSSVFRCSGKMVSMEFWLMRWDWERRSSALLTLPWWQKEKSWAPSWLWPPCLPSPTGSVNSSDSHLRWEDVFLNILVLFRLALLISEDNASLSGSPVFS